MQNNSFRVDNNPTLFTLKKGCAKEFELNRAITRCADAFAAVAPQAAVFVRHINTEENPADPLSRGKTVERHVPSALRALRAGGSGGGRGVFTQRG